MTRVLVIGGYGFFGRRLCELLKDEASVTLIIAGRTLEKAQRQCLALAIEPVQCEALRLDRNQDLAPQISIPPDVIIDMSGPFQTYGDAPYRVVEYALSIRADYFDIADSPEFVHGIAQFDGPAKAAGCAVLSGLSTYPVLTAAVLTELQKDMNPITKVSSGIAPSPKAGIGRSVIDAIAAYAGRPIARFENGQMGTRHGLTETRREIIAVPGGLPLRGRVFSNVEAPDADELPKFFPQLHSIYSSAGPAPNLLHHMLITLSRLTKRRLFPGLKGMSGMMAFFQKALMFGPHRGGMFVRADDGSNTRTWHMVAETDTGPHTPAIPAAVLVSAIAQGRRPPPGARAGTMDVNFDDFAKAFAGLGIAHGIRNDSARRETVYQEIFGPAFDTLPPEIQTLHRITDTHVFTGTAKITRGKNPLSSIVNAVLRFPKAGDDVPVTVTMSRQNGGELWVRNFGGRKMKSTQEAGRGRRKHIMVERFGPFSIGLALCAENGRLYNHSRGWAFLGIPLPKFLRPGGEVFEYAEGGVFHFHVDLRAPIFGRLVKYEGHLIPQSD